MKTKALISFAVTAKLICAFVFAYAKGRFSHDKAHKQETQENSCKNSADIASILDSNKNAYFNFGVILYERRFALMF